MAKRRTIPLFDLFPRTSGPEGQAGSGVGAGQASGGQPPHAMPGAPGPKANKPVVRLPLRPNANPSPSPEQRGQTSGHDAGAQVDTSPTTAATRADNPSDDVVAELKPSAHIAVPTTAPSTNPSPPSPRPHRHVGNTSTIGMGEATYAPAPHIPLVPPTPANPAAQGGRAEARPAGAVAAATGIDPLAREVRVPQMGLWIMGFVAICGAFVVWGIAYKLGFTDGKTSTEELVRRDPPAGIVEPTPGNVARNDQLVTVTPGLRSNQPTEAGTTRPAGNPERGNLNLGDLGRVTPAPLDRPAPSPSFAASSDPNAIRMPADLKEGKYTDPKAVGQTMQPDGWANADPRVAGLNYLLLGMMPRQDAGEAVEFLGLNGMVAFATPVDNSINPAKDSGQAQNYQVWVGPGLSREDLRADKNDPVEARVARLGEFWSKQAKKRYNFAKPQWVRFTGENK